MNPYELKGIQAKFKNMRFYYEENGGFLNDEFLDGEENSGIHLCPPGV